MRATSSMQRPVHVSRRPSRCASIDAARARAAGRPGCCGRRPRPPRPAPRAAAAQLGDVLVVDDGGVGAAHEHERHVRPRRRQSHRSPKSGTIDLVALGEEPVVAPRPRAVGTLARRCAGCRAAATTRERVGLKSTVRSRISSKLANVSGPFDEVDDRRRLVAVDARRDVDEHELADERRATARSSASAVRPPSDMPTTAAASGASCAHHRRRPTRAFSAGQYAWSVAPVGVTVAGQVDREQRSVEGERDGVPGVRVLRAAVQEHELGRPGAPPQRAQRPCPGSTSTLDALDRRRTVDTGARPRPRCRRSSANSSYSMRRPRASPYAVADGTPHPAGVARRRRPRDPRAARARSRTLRGDDAAVLNVFGTIAKHPKLMKRWLVFANHVLHEVDALGPRTASSRSCASGWRCHAPYEWGQHVVIGQRGRASPTTTSRAIADGPGRAGLDARTRRAILRAADELHDRVDDHRRHLGHARRALRPRSRCSTSSSRSATTTSCRSR